MPFNHDSSSGSPLPTACMLVISISVTSFTASPVTVISLVDGLYVTVTSHVSVTSNVILLPVASPIQFCSPLAVFSATLTWSFSAGATPLNTFVYVPSAFFVITFSGASSGLPFHKTPQISSEPATTYVDSASGVTPRYSAIFSADAVLGYVSGAASSSAYLDTYKS